MNNQGVWNSRARSCAPASRGKQREDSTSSSNVIPHQESFVFAVAMLALLWEAAHMTLCCVEALSPCAQSTAC